jgi:prepilin-type N-terminal cleavage/methylation domain-containing protein
MVGINTHRDFSPRGPLQRRRVTPRRFRTLRQAFTLLEVILSLVILGAALAIFGEVMQLANQNAADARAETQAQLLASSLMDEILAGSIDDSPANRQPLEVDDEVRWIYSVSTGTATVEGVYPLVVEVEQDVEAKFNPVKYRLVRWLSTTPEGSEAEEEADADSQQRSQQSQNQSSGQQQQGGAGTAGGAGQAGGAGSAGGSQR